MPQSMIEVKRFMVPAQVQPGQLRRLSCQYELHGASLHAMKLFKDNKEFYRYTPSNPPGDQRLNFPLPGVQVDLSRSNERDVWLRINKRSSGQYKCQVTIEERFMSVSAEKQMDVLLGLPPPPPSQPTAGVGAPAATAAGVGLDQTANGAGMWRHHHASQTGASRTSGGAHLQQGQQLRHLRPEESYNLNNVMLPPQPASSNSATGYSVHTWPMSYTLALLLSVLLCADAIPNLHIVVRAL